MKLTFKNGALFLALGLTALFLQTACVNEAERLAAEQKCQISQNEKYSFGFDGFLNPKKVIFREMANGKIIKVDLCTREFKIESFPRLPPKPLKNVIIFF